MSRRKINNIISVFYTLIKFSLIKIKKRKDFSFCLIERFSPNVVTEFVGKSKIKFGNKVRVHSGTRIKVKSKGELVICDNVKINYNCIIACHKYINIGEGTELGPSVYIYDHDHDYKSGLSKDKYISTPVRIGKNCWIGADTVILKGTILEDNCVVGAGCVISGYYPSNSVIIQKRQDVVKSYIIDT